MQRRTFNNRVGLERIKDPDPNRKKPNMTAIKALRQAYGYTLSDVERKGFNRYSYSHIEGGAHKTSKKMQVSIGDILAIRPQFIFDAYGYAVKLSPKDILTLAIMKKRKRKV